ncbi:MAG: hypothetical protein AABZ57_06905, partial [Candidatus Margulisiibacteriota bacterium]
MDSTDAVTLAYGQLRVNTGPRSSRKAAGVFIKECYALSDKIAERLSSFLTEQKDLLFPGYPFETIPVSNISTDFMGLINDDELVPYPVDINFYYAAEGLKAVDPSKYECVKMRSRLIAEELHMQLEDLVP